MDWQQFAEQMASMARDLLAQPSVDATLKRITGSAYDLVEGCDAAGILILHGRQAQTLAPTEDRAVECDQLQGRLGEGASMPRATRSANGCSGSLISRGMSHAGPALRPPPTTWGWAA